VVKETVSIRIEPEIYQDAKVEAAKKRMKIGEFVGLAIKNQLRKKK